MHKCIIWGCNCPVMEMSVFQIVLIDDFHCSLIPRLYLQVLARTQIIRKSSYFCTLSDRFEYECVIDLNYWSDIT